MNNSGEDDEKPLVKIPIVPHMYINKSCVCTPDGGFLYVGLRCITYIAQIGIENKQPEIKVFHARQNIMGVDVDPAWGGKDGRQPRQFVILAEDNSLQIWDFEHTCPLIGHKVHTSVGRYIDGSTSRETPVLFGYMHSGNVLSMDSHDIVIYCVTSNTYCKMPSFVSSRHNQLKVLQCSPYNENVFAVGTARGSVLICDLYRKSIIYTLRGHDSCITSISWMHVPIPKTKILSDTDSQEIEVLNEAIKLLTKSYAKTKLNNSVKTEGDDDIFDIYDYDYLEQEFGAPSASVDTTCAEYEGIEKQNSINNCEKFDYMEACQSLKADLQSINNDNEIQKQDDGEENTAITLAECQAAAAGIKRDPSVTESSSSNLDDKSNTAAETEHCGSTSSDDIIIDGSTPKHLVQILHQADVHAAQSHILTRKDSQQSLNNDENTAENDDKKTVELEVPEKPLDDDNHHDVSLNGTSKVVGESKSKLKEKPIDTVETINVEGAKDFLLVSASADGQYWVWNTLTGGACDNMQARSVGHQKNKTQYLEVSWFNGIGFLGSNRNGNLIQWLLDDNEEAKYKFKENPNFNMPEPAVHFAVCQKNNVIWCTNFKREVFCKDLTSGKMLAQYSCLPTNIAILSECVDNLNHIALGCSDRRIAIIDVSNIEPKNISMKTLSMRVDSVVTALAWSPDCKKLAFCTMEGRTGVFNIEKPQDMPFIFHPVSGKRVYSIIWTEHGIYCVCNNTLACYDSALKKKDASIITEISEVTSVTAYDNYVLAGTQSGCITVLRRNESNTKSWECLQNVQAAKRYITFMCWNPLHKTQLAVVSSSNELKIFKINSSSGMLEQTHSVDMENPKAACATVKWSYHKSNMLVTAGFDGAVRVFELVEQQYVQKFLKLYDFPIMCAMFMPMDEQVLMCCGKSIALEFIDMKKVASDDFMLSRSISAKKTKSTVQWAVKILSHTAKLCGTANIGGANFSRLLAESNQEPTVERRLKFIPDAKLEIANRMKNLELGEDNLENLYKIDRSNESSALYTKNPTTLLYLTTKELNKDALEKLMSILNAHHCKHGKNAQPAMVAKLLGSQQQAKDLLAEEMRNLQKMDKVKDVGGILLGQLNPNAFKEDILKSVQNRTLNEWHISVAPTISYQFWQKCCKAFADQLEEQGYILQAASYLLATHDQNSTIDILVKHHFYKEALLVARIYLQPHAPEFQNIIDKWIEYLHSTGNIPAAALICTLSGQINRGYNELSKLRNTSPEIERALKLLKTHEKFQ